MVRYLLDTSAVLVHYLGENEAGRVTALFADPANELFLAAPSISELSRKLTGLGLEPADVRQHIDTYLSLFSELVPIDEAVAWSAVEIANHTPDRVPLIDSLIAAAARERDACLVHRDRHLAAIPPEVVSQLDLAS